MTHVRRRSWYDRNALWLDPVLFVVVVGLGALFVVGGVETGEIFATVLFGGITFMTATLVVTHFVGVVRRRAGLPEPPPEPTYRAPLDAQGRVQESDGSARTTIWLAPLLGAVALVGGAFVVGERLEAADPTGAAVGGGVALLLGLSGWFGFVQARRALRSDREESRR